MREIKKKKKWKKKNPTPVLCLKIPDEDEVVFDEIEQKEIRKETTTTKRGKRKRGHECDVCEKVFVTIQFGQTHAYAHERETVRM